jgi:hypothetical protein
MRRQCQFTVKRPEKRVDLTVAPEQQPSGVQVVERVGLVASSLQFFTRLAAVFAEEVGGFFIQSNKMEKSSDVLLSSFFAFTSVPLAISS